MLLIIGLGNPGEKYVNNRHNAGFMFIDYLKNKLEEKSSTPFKEQKMLHVICYALRDLILAKPQTFMNLAGEAVKACVTRYTLHVTRDLIVAHDDLDIPLGKFKIQKGVGPELHNGILSIEQRLKTKDFCRIRIGIDNRHTDEATLGKARRSLVPGETYVLQDFTEEEKQILLDVYPAIIKNLI